MTVSGLSPTERLVSTLRLLLAVCDPVRNYFCRNTLVNLGALPQTSKKYLRTFAAKTSKVQNFLKRLQNEISLSVLEK